MTTTDTSSDQRDSFNTVIEHLIPRAHQMGIETLELRPGYVRARAPFEGNTNHLGTMYAGTLFALGEILGGALFFSSFDIAHYYPIVKDLQIRFKSPGRGPVTATCNLETDEIDRLAAQAQAAGKAEFVLTVEIVDEADGRTIATTEGTYQLRAHGT